jgi:hypothetical protein
MDRRPLPLNPGRSLSFWLLPLLLALVVLPVPGFSQVYPPNFKFIEVPNPLSGDNPTYPLISRTEPTPGQSWTDSRFGTAQTRVTQTSTLLQEYSRFDPFNCHQSMILLYDTSGNGLVYPTTSTPYDQPANLVRTIDDLDERRWDPSDPNIIWGFQNLSIVKLDVTTGAETVVKDFSKDDSIAYIFQTYPNIYRITCMDEGESSRDKRYWALALQNFGDLVNPDLDYAFLYLITWDRLQDKVLGVRPLSVDQRQNLDWVGMSTQGGWVVVGGGSDGGVPENWGLMMASKDFSVWHLLHQNTGHADVGLDAQDREVIVMQNAQTDYVDLIPLDLQAKPVNVVEDYTNNLIRPIVRLYYDDTSSIGLKSGVHVSCNYPGYCLISTTIPPDTPEQNWLDRCNILVRLDPNHARAVYLAKIYNTTQQYWEETHGTITNDGSKVVWADDWGKSVPDGTTPQMTVTQLNMPPHWQNQFVPPLPAVLSLLLGN